MAGDSYDALKEQTEVVELQGLIRPPVGRTILSGELVRIVDANPPASERVEGDDFLFDPGTPSFATVMTYFWLDSALRYLRRLGFRDLLTEGVEADPRDGTARGGAFYSPWNRQMGFAPPGPERPGMAEDAKVILHEFGHAVQDNQVRGWGGHPEVRAMGEGFGDALATIYFAHVNRGFHNEVLGDWVHPPEGIRRVDRDVRYPQDMVGEPHHDGQIWSRALWDLYRFVEGDSASEEAKLGARDITLRLIVQSHYFLRPGATFADGARALLLADQAMNQGRYAAAIRQAVADRGIPVEGQQALPSPLTDEQYANLARTSGQRTRGFPWWL